MKPDWEKPQKALRCSAHNWPCPSHKSRPGIHLREEQAKYQPSWSSWASCQVAKTKFVQQVLCSAVSLNVSTPDQRVQSHSAVYSNIRRARFTMDFTTYDERCWFAASQSYLCPGIYSKITKNIKWGKSNDESGKENGKSPSSRSWGLHKSRCKV